MGNSYNATQVIRRGKPVDSVGGDSVKPTERVGEVLVAVVHNGLYAIAEDVTAEGDFKALYEQYRTGNWIQMRVYALLKEQIPNCHSRGRTSIRSLTAALKEHPQKTETRG